MCWTSYQNRPSLFTSSSFPTILQFALKYKFMENVLFLMSFTWSMFAWPQSFPCWIWRVTKPSFSTLDLGKSLQPPEKKISSFVMLVGICGVLCWSTNRNRLLDGTFLHWDVGGRHLGVWGYVSPLQRCVRRYICAAAAHGKVTKLLCQRPYHRGWLDGHGGLHSRCKNCSCGRHDVWLMM